MFRVFVFCLGCSYYFDNILDAVDFAMQFVDWYIAGPDDCVFCYSDNCSLGDDLTTVAAGNTQSNAGFLEY